LSSSPPILQTTLAGRRPDRQGKVRDIYELGDELLIVATDRISAFDYVLGSGIPDKGKVLTQISAFWFDRTRPIVANHVVSTDPSSYPAAVRADAALLRGRSMLVRRTQPAGFLFPRGCASPTACPSRSSRRRRKPRAATTSTSVKRRRPSS
jgi:phosphoribosylaminoimidazole-succinocarboxamide synthase